MARPRKDITGHTYGRLTVIEDIDHGKNPAVQCTCTCGKTVVARKSNVLKGNTRSCGCLRAQNSGYRNRPKKERVPVQDIDELGMEDVWGTPSDDRDCEY